MDVQGSTMAGASPTPSFVDSDSDDDYKEFTAFDRKRSLKNLRQKSSSNLRKSVIDSALTKTKNRPLGEFKAVRNADISGTTLSSATTVSMPLQNRGYDIHENGYFVAAKNMCKLVTPSSKSVTIAGGRNVTNFGEIQVKAQKPGKVTTTKQRHCVLKNGTLKFYALNISPEVLDENPPEDLLHRNETLYIQNIRNIKMKGPKSKSFTLVYWNEPKRTWIERSGDQMMKLTLRRNKGKKKKKLSNTMTEEFKKASSHQSRKNLRSSTSQSQLLLAPRTNSAHSLSGLLNFQSTLSRKKSRSLSFRSETEATEDDPDLADVELDKNTKDERDLPNYVTETITITASSPEEASRWMRFILIAIENQAVVFAAFSDILHKDPTHVDGAEALRRHSVDLLTLAKGHSHPKVLEARKKLADVLEDNGRFDESAMWYDLAEENYTESDKAGFNVNDAFFQLVEFFTDNNVINPDEEARKLFERRTPSQIALKLHTKFNRVPTGWGYYLRELSNKSMLAKFQVEIQNLKSGDYFFSTRFGTVLE